MIHQDGTLIIIIKNKLCHRELFNGGYYFVFKIGNKCVRFHTPDGTFKFFITKEEYNKTIDLFIFKRERIRKRSPGDNKPLTGVNMIRQMVSRDTIDFLKLRPTLKVATRIEWNSIEVDFINGEVALLLDIEFYPTLPLLPGKIREAHALSEGESSLKPPLPSRYKKPLVNYTHVPEHRRSSSKPLNYVRSAFSLSHSLNKKEQKRYQLHNAGSTIMLETKENYSISDMKSDAGYIHGDSTFKSNTTDVNPVLIANYIRKNVQPHKNPDKLSLYTTPREYLQSEYNRLLHNESIDFSHPFSIDNIRVTGYVGNGRWCDSALNDSSQYYYLMKYVTAFPSPRLPPKCPINMLLEEYYLIDKKIT
ncbi:hypothetical protein TPHA_0F01980 [Tetrapisispora phaffii CBS 4417]|uniref:Uncharacterized protein n=1 Tax=Tetrapisispora phaffii (strain ATCC 24235 / CBS 4417 / NBRC 1672 / NRRL Y-8282 / UCD 70-5) TaxID=1071381 RepID=G8BV98_TETPH|nr:hypothetical protein TPHA_0F01980 [Tetrapisispora phaffii CBS 4417]CCE63680.1 hypothetical protein TPHA_0F01980 [Tetrapisispora phaffii CBS 4417]